jgi:hypothetical protein
MRAVRRWQPLVWTLPAWVALALVVACAIRPSGAAQEGLPEGAGLASQYPGDVGLAQDPRVLLAEDFETGSVEDLAKRWEEVGNKDGKVLAFSDDVPPDSAGRRSLQMTATLGENSGGHLYRRLPRGVDRAFLRFYTKFAPDVAYEHHFVSLGGYNPPTPWPNPRAGSRPQGDDRVAVFIDCLGDYGRYPPPGFWSLYTYWHEMKISADGRYWGNCLTPARRELVPRGRWQCVELMLKLNTVGQWDGELALWLDGKLYGDFVKGERRGPWSGMGFDLVAEGGELFEGLNLRTAEDLRVNYLWLEHYIDQGAQDMNHLQNPNRVNRVWFDDVVVATEYIGPVRKQ